MNIGVAKERAPGELRVALGPDSIAKLIKGGAAIFVERGAGSAAGFPDAVLEKAGATLTDDARSLYAQSAIVLRVQPPTLDEVAALAGGRRMLSLMPRRGTARSREGARGAEDHLARARAGPAHHARAVDGRALVAEHRRRLQGGAHRRRGAAEVPADAHDRGRQRSRRRKVFVIGAGVAGLQAIATARRLGGVVSAFDVRPAAREQVRQPRRDVRRDRARRAPTRRPPAATRARRRRTSSSARATRSRRTSTDSRSRRHHGADSRARRAEADHRGDGRSRCGPAR